MIPTVAPKVIIIGGGFAGLEAAKALAGSPLQITLIDRRNHFVFQPLLYQVATAALSPGDIAAPIRWVLRRHKNVTVLLAEVVDINLAQRQITLADGEQRHYDYLILAAGGRTSYFGHDDWIPVAPGLKSIEDALELRRRILLAFEAAEREVEASRRQSLLTFVVVGGGPTGAELAGALVEIARYTLRHDFRVIDPSQARVILIEAGPRVLASFPKSLSESAEHQLSRLGVEVITGVAVRQITDQWVELADDRVIEAATVIWAAGVAAVALTQTLGVECDRAGRIYVEPDLSLPGYPEVFAVGDLATVREQASQRMPGVAPNATQTGLTAALNLLRRWRGEPTQPYRYWDKGSMATIGRAAGVAYLFNRLPLSGYPAWLSWLLVHLYYLIGFDNRVVVMARWAWAYFTRQRSARLITGDTRLAARHERQA